ncbi:MAG: hypothetical protein AAF677_13635 [Pseudomonadota bacterium]
MAPIVVASAGSAALGVARAADAPAVCGPTARVTFREGAPVDRYLIENLSPGDWAIARLEIALAGSAGRLVFDTVGGGPGRNVAQPFVVRSGEGDAALAAMPDIPDGAEAMVLAFERFMPGQVFRFTIDMDDRLAGWGTTVDGPEIEGAAVTVRFVDAGGAAVEVFASFDGQAVARPTMPCVS